MDHLPLSSFTIAVQGVGVMVSTFVKHFTQRKEVTKDVAARDDLLFDEAFSVVKHFFERASLSTVEEIQKFGNTYIPAPFWVRVIKVMIPISTRLEAGRILIDTLGEKEIQEVVGGREWWQRTSEKSGGIGGEWISMKSDWAGLNDEALGEEEKGGAFGLRAEKLRDLNERAKEKTRKAHERLNRKGKGKQEEEDADESEDAESREGDREETARGEQENYTEDMDEMRCMMYVNGGAYFFGSINTHRYSIWRYARKTGGRAFAVSYRLSPQYPFPCALSDALASYLYLIRPPPDAKHRPVDPKKLTLAGDSAGGGLVLALLCLIRDSGLPAPAGGILISPWCDLTHSFPSILENTETDVIPPYGFLFKPSTLWPPPPPDFQDRANKQTSITSLRAAYLEKQDAKARSKANSGFLSRGRATAERKGEELADKTKEGEVDKGGNPNDSQPKAAEQSGNGAGEGKKEGMAEVGEVLRVRIDGEEVEIDSQIQLYATNAQLVYPYVSPLWQPSLGGLPPLYVLAGDKEVLRDEIIYMAHRAANPALYPLRKALLEANPERTRKHAEYGPTKVHLQVYDDACHDIPLFSFTTPAKFAYRAIASFAKFVTSTDGSPPSPVSPRGMTLPGEGLQTQSPVDRSAAPSISSGSEPIVNNVSSPTSSTFLSPPLSTNGSPAATTMGRERSNSTLSRGLQSVRPVFTRAKSSSQKSASPGLDSTIYSSMQPFNRPPYVDNMVRERVSITGVVREMEPVAEVKILHIDPEEVGLVKEGPVKRYLAGKALWDKRFKKTYERVQKRREHHLSKSVHEETLRILKRVKEKAKSASSATSSSTGPASPGGIRSESPEPLEAVEGIWELHGERPPPSSIAARKDTSEARRLAHVLDTHYSKIHALHLWTGVNDVAGAASGSRRRQDSQALPEEEK